MELVILLGVVLILVIAGWSAWPVALAFALLFVAIVAVSS